MNLISASHQFPCLVKMLCAAHRAKCGPKLRWIPLTEKLLSKPQVLLKKPPKIDLPRCPWAVRVGVRFIFSISRSILFFTMHFIDSDIKFEALTFEWPQRILFYHSHSLRARTWTSKACFYWSENQFLLHLIQPWRTSRRPGHIQTHLSQRRVDKRIRL